MNPKKDVAPNLYLALVHYPVINKNGDTIASAITNLDLHDISRAARTYGVKAFYVVTPLTDQKELAEKIVSHWVDGFGARYNPKRGEALRLIRFEASVDDVVADIHDREGESPKTLATCAKRKGDPIDYGHCRELMQDGTPYLLIFGTAWGLADDLFTGADFTLEPILGNETYNHLSVRSAAAIILDRLMGQGR